VKRRTRAAVRHARGLEGARGARGGGREGHLRGGHAGREPGRWERGGVILRTTLERIQEFRKIQGVWIDPLMKKKGS
jgi:hypothetical protein